MVLLAAVEKHGRLQATGARNSCLWLATSSKNAHPGVAQPASPVFDLTLRNSFQEFFGVETGDSVRGRGSKSPLLFAKLNWKLNLR